MHASGAAAGDGVEITVDDSLTPIERLTDINHFDIVELLGQGSNGAVFKVSSLSCRRQETGDRRLFAEVESCAPMLQACMYVFVCTGKGGASEHTGQCLCCAEDRVQHGSVNDRVHPAAVQRGLCGAAKAAPPPKHQPVPFYFG